ncbi:MAG TPA: CPBP family intramembrane glutamic endopeptidase [Chthoniobacterales bacterium]|nr:CPBP family intramembrane glutamic endopeptidase [Chthoniobacterales bacterium]
MIAAGKIVSYLLGTVLLGALLAPPFYWLGLACSQISALHFLKDTDFQRYFARSTVISAFLLLPLVLRWIGLQRFHQLGLSRNPFRWRDVVAGFFLAITITAVLGLIAIQSGIYTLKSHLPWHLVAGVFFPALSVAVIEEFLFRGAILGLVRQTLSTVPAIVLVSALFSIVHFLRPVDGQISVVQWYSGFALLEKVFWRFSDPLLVGGGFMTIFVLGLLLAHSAVGTRSLWLSIGLHAGIVFGKMSFNKLTKQLAEAPPWFGPELTVGLGSVVTLLSLWFVVWLLFLRRAFPPRTCSNDH